MVYLLDEAHGDEFVAYHVPGMERPCQFPVEARVFRFDILLYDFRLKVLLAPLLVRARSFFSEDRSAGVSWDAGAGACLSDLFSDILTSHLIIRFCLASSSDLCSSVFLKDVTSSRRASALRFASWSCSCKKDICCCNNAIISSFFILQRYEKKTRLPNKASCIIDDNITGYQVFTSTELSIFSLLRYLTDLSDIPSIIAERVLYGITQAFLPVLK